MKTGKSRQACLYEFQETKCRRTDGVIEGRWQKCRALLHTENYFQQDIRPHEYALAVLKYAGFLQRSPGSTTSRYGPFSCACREPFCI